METTIPKAYCSLLNTLQVICTSGQLFELQVSFYLAFEHRLQSRHPWEIMNSTLYKMISENALFYSSSVNKWLTLDESKFLFPNIFNAMGLPDADILSYTNKAVTMLHIAVVSLQTCICNICCSSRNYS